MMLFRQAFHDVAPCGSGSAGSQRPNRRCGGSPSTTPSRRLPYGEARPPRRALCGLRLAAIGVDGEGNKHPLALVGGATENAATVQALLDNLVSHGLDPTMPRLFIALDRPT